MTPTTAATGKQITITNTKDVNNFVYPSLYSLANLTFSIVIPPNLIAHFDMLNSVITKDASNQVSQVSNLANPLNPLIYKSGTKMLYVANRNGYPALSVGISQALETQSKLTTGISGAICYTLYFVVERVQNATNYLNYHMSTSDTAGPGTTQMFVNTTNTFTSNCHGVGQLYQNLSVSIPSLQANTRNVFVISKAPGNTASDILLYYNTTNILNQTATTYGRSEIPGDGFLRVGSFPIGWGINPAGYYSQEVMMFSVNHTVPQITANISALMTKWGIV
jgi:hypothetical protein